MIRGLIPASVKTRSVAAAARPSPVRIVLRRSARAVALGFLRLMIAPVSVNQISPGARRSMTIVPQRETEFTST